MSSEVSKSHFSDLISKKKKGNKKMRRDVEEGGKGSGSDGVDTI